MVHLVQMIALIRADEVGIDMELLGDIGHDLGHEKAGDIDQQIQKNIDNMNHEMLPPLSPHDNTAGATKKAA
jgi:hypothetical protein